MPGDGLGDLHGVADRPDVGVAGVLVAIDPDRACRAHLQAGFDRQGARGPYADVDDDEVGGQGGAVGQGDRHGAGRAGLSRLADGAAQCDGYRAGRRDGLGGHAQTQVDPVYGELVGQQGRELGVQWRQNVVGQLDEVDLQTAGDQGLDRLEADESGTDDDGARAWLGSPAGGQQFLDALHQGVDVGDGAKRVHGGVVQALDGRTHGHRTWGQQECVVRQCVGVVPGLNGDFLGEFVEAGDPVAGAHIQVQGRGE